MSGTQICYLYLQALNYATLHSNKLQHVYKLEKVETKSPISHKWEREKNSVLHCTPGTSSKQYAFDLSGGKTPVTDTNKTTLHG